MPSATFTVVSTCSMNCWLGSAAISRSVRQQDRFTFFWAIISIAGPSSRETIDRLIEHGETHESVFLKGNHELIAIKCLSDRGLFDQWMRLGGLETLVSYGVPAETLANGKQIAELQSAFHDALPQAHFRFFRDLQNSFACGDFFFAHAGVKPDVELSRQKESDLLWIREKFLSSTRRFRQDRRSRAYAHPRNRGRAEPDQYRYRCLCDRPTDMSCDLRRNPCR